VEAMAGTEAEVVTDIANEGQVFLKGDTGRQQ